jgi:tetratricopeptide (TPR) repeat protein
MPCLSRQKKPKKPATRTPHWNITKDIYDATKDKAANIRIAVLNFELRDYQRAEKILSRVVQRDRGNQYPELKYLYAMTLKHNGKYADAEDMFGLVVADNLDSALVAKSKLEIAGCKLGRKAKQPELLTVDNLGKKANSPQTEASPSYSGGELYFTSLAAKERCRTLDGKEGDWYAKVYSAAPPAQAGGEYGELLRFSAPKSTGKAGTRATCTSLRTARRCTSRGWKRRTTTRKNEQDLHYATKGDDGWGAATEATGVNGDYHRQTPLRRRAVRGKSAVFRGEYPRRQRRFRHLLRSLGKAGRRLRSARERRGR